MPAVGALTFKQIQDAVLSDRFREAQRGDCKNWINFRYWWIWHLEQWTFRYATANVSVTSGSQGVGNLPVDFLIALALLRSDGTPLTYFSPAGFFRRFYNNTQQVSGTPESYTIVGGQFYVAPFSNETKSDYLLPYQREFTPLINDSDVPALPVGAHFGLVHGGAAEGLKLQNDFTWQAFEQDFAGVLQILRSGYLIDQRDRSGSYPSDPIG